MQRLLVGHEEHVKAQAARLFEEGWRVVPGSTVLNAGRMSMVLERQVTYAYPPQPTQHILRANLDAALFAAIHSFEKDGRGDICLVDGWREVLQALRNGQPIEVRESPR